MHTQDAAGDIDGDAADIASAEPGAAQADRGAVATWDIFVNAVQGRLGFQVDGANVVLLMDESASANLLQLGTNASNEVTITGDLVVSGACSAGGTPGCDIVFTKHYPLESLQEHAAFMWENSYLIGVGATPEDAPWNIARKSAGMLNELEKAHIYIEQLHNRLTSLEAKMAEADK